MFVVSLWKDSFLRAQQLSEVAVSIYTTQTVITGGNTQPVAKMKSLLFFFLFVSLSKANGECNEPNVYCCQSVSCNCPPGMACPCPLNPPQCKLAKDTSKTPNCCQGVCGPCPDEENIACFCGEGELIGQPTCPGGYPRCD